MYSISVKRKYDDGKEVTWYFKGVELGLPVWTLSLYERKAFESIKDAQAALEDIRFSGMRNAKLSKIKGEC